MSGGVRSKDPRSIYTIIRANDREICLLKCFEFGVLVSKTDLECYSDTRALTPTRIDFTLLEDDEPDALTTPPSPQVTVDLYCRNHCLSLGPRSKESCKKRHHNGSEFGRTVC